MLSRPLTHYRSKGNNYPAKSCGVYGIRLPAADVSAAIETSDRRAGPPWRVLSVSPEITEALIAANRSLALLDLAKGSITKIEGQLSGGSFSPDGKWIAALQLGDPKAPSKMVLIDRANLANRRDLGGVEDAEVVLVARFQGSCSTQSIGPLVPVRIRSRLRRWTSHMVRCAARRRNWSHLYKVPSQRINGC